MKICMCILGTLVSLAAAAIPDGFVYRGRVKPVDGVTEMKGRRLDVTFSLYASLGANQALWTGTTNVLLSADGLFQVWVSDGIRTGDGETLKDALANGHARALGVRFGDDPEQHPRQSFTTLPTVNYAHAAANVDDGGSITGRVEASLLTTEKLSVGGATSILSLDATGSSDTLKLDELVLSGTGGINMKRSADEHRGVFARECPKRKTGLVIHAGTALVGPSGSGAIFTSDRGGVIAISAGRLAPCISLFANAGETLEAPFELGPASAVFVEFGK